METTELLEIQLQRLDACKMRLTLEQQKVSRLEHEKEQLEQLLHQQEQELPAFRKQLS